MPMHIHRMMKDQKGEIRREERKEQYREEGRKKKKKLESRSFNNQSTLNKQVYKSGVTRTLFIINKQK